MTIARQLALAFGAILLLMCGLAGVAWWGLAGTNSRLQGIYHENTVPLGQVSEVMRYGQRDRILIQDMVANPDAANVQKRSAEIFANREMAAKQWKLYLAAESTPEQKKLADAFNEASLAYVEGGILPAVAKIKAGDADGIRETVKRISATSPRFTDLLQKMIDLQINQANEQFKASQAEFSRLKFLFVGALLAALLVGVASAILITRRLTRRLGAEPDDLAAIAGRVAHGDLADTCIRPAPKGSVLDAMQTMRGSLVKVVSVVRSGVDNVATASSQIAQGNLDLSSRTEEQASSLQQTAASVEQLNGTVSSSAESARQASQLAAGASLAAARGGEVVGQVVTTMDAISASSKKIADIIGVIDGIAFQTNILALNAAVEAARAGEQGRGFAVVASEVRGLAQRSANAAKEIKSLIAASVAQVASGNDLVSKAGEAMGDIVTRVQRVTDLISEVTAAASEQCAGIGQINTAVAQIDQTTQSNAALVEESAAAADSLKLQAQRLTQAVAAFVLPMTAQV